jgi:hypothetical protein
VVVEHDDPHRAGRSLREPAGGVPQLRGSDAAGLVEPGTDGVEADDVEALGAVGRLRGLPAALELLVGAGEAGDGRIGDVVVARNRQNRPIEALEEVGGAVVLLGTPPVGQVAARDDQLGIDALDEAREARLKPRLFAAADVKIREV